MMKAVICTKYGPPEVLQIREVTKPVCHDDEILVKIMAAGVNSGDVRVRGLAVKGLMKALMRVVLGFSGPRKPVLGNVFSGIVEQAGSNTSQFRVGDKVFGITGFKFGTYAEYIHLREKSIIARMPENASFEEAAALPFGWHTAIHFLKRAGIEERKKPAVLIYGATGSVGTAAVQLAKHFGALLTVVCSSEGKALMKVLGADHVICYDQQDFTRLSQKFDIIFDAVGKTSGSACKHLLNPKGRFVTVGGWAMAAENIGQLHFIRQLFEKGECKAIVDKVYPFCDIVEAHRYVDTGRKKGNVVITLCQKGKIMDHNLKR